MIAQKKQEKERILIVEDEEDQRLRLKYVLESEGYTVEDAEDGEKASVLCSKKNYSLVITDLKMPGEIDGLGVLQNVKSQSPDTEVLIVTAYGTVNSAVRAMISGAYDYIQKPVNMSELRVKIRRALDNRAVLKEADGRDMDRNNARAFMSQVQELQNRIGLIRNKLQSLLDKKDIDPAVLKDLKKLDQICQSD